MRRREREEDSVIEMDRHIKKKLFTTRQRWQNIYTVSYKSFNPCPAKRIMGNPVRLRERVESLHVYVLGREDGVDEGLVEAVEGASEKNICVHKKKWKLTMK